MVLVGMVGQVIGGIFAMTADMLSSLPPGLGPAVASASLLPDTDKRAGSTEIWQSHTDSPLAADLLSSVRIKSGLANLGAIGDAIELVGPTSGPDSPSQWGWEVSVAQRCPDPLLSSALLKAAGLEPGQRDSFCVSALSALARS
jgi:hypothetical protein